MKLLWPEALWAAAVLAPLLVLLYLWLLHRRKKSTVRFASIALVRQALGKGPGWRRHVPPLLLGLALLTLMVAISRPTAVIKLPSQQETIILAMDVSGSMRASDIKPTRLAASQEAAKSFGAYGAVSHEPGHRIFAASMSMNVSFCVSPKPGGIGRAPVICDRS